MKKELVIKELDRIFQIDWSKLNASKLLKDLDGWDSLKQIQLILLVEKLIKKKLEVKNILKIKKVGDINYFIK